MSCLRALALTALCGSAAACASVSPTPDTLLFPKNEDTGVWTLAATSGTLVVDRGCLRLRHDNGTVETIYWETPFELVTHAGKLAILDATDGRLFAVGTHVALGGGEMNAADASRLDPIAARQCGPPFSSGWIDDREPGQHW